MEGPPLPHLRLDLVNQAVNIRRRCPPQIQNKVGMALGHLGITQAATL
jgi:hypothetical protein